MQTTVEIGPEFRVRRPCRGRQRPHDQLAAGGQEGETLTAQVT
jgi:hypothetical protein